MNKYEQRVRQLTYFGGNLPPQTPNTLPEAELKAVEGELGHSLPSDYRQFLRDYGDFFVASSVEIPEPKPNGPSYGGVEFFYGVTPSTPFRDLLTKYRRRGPGWPPEYLPIAEGQNGYTCLVIAGDEKGTIYLWNCGDTGGAEPENFHFVARSFHEFMHLLDPRSEEQSSPRS